MEKLQMRPGSPEELVIRICDAYESGIGHGLDRDNFVNPYTPLAYEHLAYYHGFVTGQNRLKERENKS